MFTQFSKAAVVALLVVINSVAMSAEAGAIKISDAWARNSAPGAPSAGFLMVKNQGDTDDTLLSVEGDFAKKLELHRTMEVDGVMKMVHQAEGIVIPAGAMVSFKPGGYHLMFMGLTKNFEVDEVYEVDLVFEKAGRIRVELPVKTMAMDTMTH